MLIANTSKGIVMRAAASLVLLLLGVVPGVVSAGEPVLGYKDVPLGSTIALVAEHYPELTCQKTEGGPLGDIKCEFSRVDRCLTPTISLAPFADKNSCMTAVGKAGTYGGKVARTSLRFIDNKLGRVEVVTAAYEFISITDSLVAKYGEPRKKDNFLVQNKMGASFQNQRWIWRFGDAELRYSKYGSNINDSLLTITSDSYLQQIGLRRKSEAQSTLSDL